MLKAGDTFFIDSGHTGKHLFVVLNDPDTVDGYGKTLIAVAVSFSTIYPNVPHDDSCILQAGDHEFITHPSFAYYRETRIIRSTEYVGCIKSGTYTPGKPVTADLLKKLQDGLLNSRFASREAQKCFQELTK